MEQRAHRVPASKGMEEHAHRVPTAEGEKIMAISHRFVDTEAAGAGRLVTVIDVAPINIAVRDKSELELNTAVLIGIATALDRFTMTDQDLSKSDLTNGSERAVASWPFFCWKHGSWHAWPR
jgi:hypothetical protein